MSSSDQETQETQAEIIEQLTNSVCGNDHDRVRTILTQIDTFTCSDWLFYKICQCCSFDNIKTFLQKGIFTFRNYQAGLYGAFTNRRLGLARYFIRKERIPVNFLMFDFAIKHGDERLVEFVWVRIRNEISSECILRSQHQGVVAHMCNLQYVSIAPSAALKDGEEDFAECFELYYMKEARLLAIQAKWNIIRNFTCKDIVKFTTCFVGLCKAPLPTKLQNK